MQARQAELAQPFADRAFVDLDQEAARHLCAKVNAPPAHDVVRHRIRPLDHQCLQLGHLLIRQGWGTTRSGPRLQAIDAFVVVAVHPVTQGLPIHAAQFGRFGSRIALQNQRNGQKPTYLCAIAALGGKSTKLGRRVIHARDRQRNSHHLLHPANRRWKKVNQNPADLGTPIESASWPVGINALSPGMPEDALRVIETYEADQAVKVVIMRGSGTKAFISGGDIKSFDKTRANAETARRAREAPEKLRRKMLNLEKPLIAMIHGYCFGGGLGIALNADLRFDATDSQFSIPAALRGIAYAPEGLKSLVDLVGPSIAKDIMFSARRLKADEALRIGLINRVVEPDALEAETVAYAEQLAINAPLSIRASKFFINQLGLPHDQRDGARMDAMQREAENSEDFQEATRSFMEKRKPVFRGR